MKLNRNRLISIVQCPFNLLLTFPFTLILIYKTSVELIKSGEYKQNIEALGGQFEGDMVLDERQKRAVLGLEKTGLINLNYRWPNATVPYVYADGYFTQAQIEHIERELRLIEGASCVRFVHRTDEANYVEVIVSGKSQLKSDKVLV